MIVKGAFECVSLAIYGEVASEAPSSSPAYYPKAHASLDPIPIPRALDPSTSYDPTQLARELLKLIPDAPPLELIVRLMFCLKPSHDDWDSPEFPYLHPDLEQLDEEADLEQVSELLMRPVADDIKEEILAQFCESVAGMIGEKVNVISMISCAVPLTLPSCFRTATKPTSLQIYCHALLPRTLISDGPLLCVLSS